MRRLRIYLYWYTSILKLEEFVVTQTTTVKVSRTTLELLERLRDKLHVKSIDEALKLLVLENRKRLIEEAFGADKRRIKPFTEEDRGEDRS